MTTTNIGRRRAPRLSIERQGRLRGRLSREVTILDLSNVGCLLRCDSLLDQGAILDLEIDLEAQAEPFVAKVRVAAASLEGGPGGPGAALAGLEFIGLPARADARLRHFLDEERRRRQREDAAAR
jgi:PilZ domain-containing protein